MSEWSWRKKACVFVVLYMLLALPVAELYLHLRGNRLFYSRWTFLPGIGWRNHPRLIYSDEGRGVYELFWDDGTRASRYPRPKKTQHRIAVVGCSYTEGVGVRDEETFVWKLNNRFPHTVFDNYGCSGYGPRQCYLLIEELLKTKKYESILYCAISDHLDRFVKPKSCWGTTFSDDPLSIMPWTEYSPSKNIYHKGFTFALPGARRFLSVELLNRILIEGYSAVFATPTEEKKAIMLQRTITEMEMLCSQYDTEFATIYLSGRNYLKPPPPGILAYQAYYPVVVGEVMYPDPNQEIPLQPSQGQFDNDIPDHYRVMKRKDSHPNRVIHNYWALAIGRWLREQGLVTE